MQAVSVKYRASDTESLDAQCGKLRSSFTFNGIVLKISPVERPGTFVVPIAVAEPHRGLHVLLSTPERLQELRSKHQRVQDVLAGAGNGSSSSRLPSGLPLRPPLPSLPSSGEPSLSDILSAIMALTTTVHGLQSSVVTREDLRTYHEAQQSESKAYVDSAVAPLVKVQEEVKHRLAAFEVPIVDKSSDEKTIAVMDSADRAFHCISFLGFADATRTSSGLLR